MQKLTLLTLMLLLLLPGLAGAQCCSAGNPLSTDADYQSQGAHRLKVAITGKTSASSGYYKQDALYDVGSVDRASFHYSELTLGYGITHRLSARVDAGYFFDKTEAYKNPAAKNLVGSGLGDLSVQMRYLIYKNFIHKWELSGGAGIKLPVGVFDQEVDRVKLPIQLQPSSGSFKYFGNLFFIHTPHPGFSWYALVSAQVAQRIQSVNFDYRYGEVYMLSAGVNQRIAPWLSAAMQLRGELRTRLHRENHIEVATSGGRMVYITPSVSVSLPARLFLTASVNVPLYRYHNGVQLAHRYLAAITLSRSFKLKREA